MTASDQTRRDRPAGTTSGSERRPAQRLTGSLLAFDLLAEVERLRQEPGWRQSDRNAKTLVKARSFRVVLTVLRPGARLREHATAAHVAVQALSGAMLLRSGDQTVELRAGQMLVLEPNLPHDVEALEESAFLLTLNWLGQDAERPVEVEDAG